MQIHLSWKSLLATLLFLIALGLVGRMFVARMGGDTVNVETPDATVETALGSRIPITPTFRPSPSLSASTATQIALNVTATSLQPTPQPTVTLQPTQPLPSETPQVPSPASFQPPTRIPTPVRDPVSVVAQGFGQTESHMSYAFVVNNPNPDVQAQAIRYQVAAYDAAGVVLATDDGEISMVGPNQQMGVAEEIRLPSSVIVDHIEVVLRLGEFVKDAQAQQLVVENPAFVPGQLPSLTGIVRNLTTQDLADIPIVGIVYDENGIIGGNTKTIPFVPAQGQSAFSIEVVISGQPSKIQFFTP